MILVYGDFEYHVKFVVSSWCSMLFQVHLRPAIRQSLRNLPETEAQRCLPAHPQTRPFLFHWGQDRTPHGLWQRGKKSSLTEVPFIVTYNVVLIHLNHLNYMTSCCQKAVDMLLDNEDKISVSTSEFFESSLSSWFKQIILSDWLCFDSNR